MVSKRMKLSSDDPMGPPTKVISDDVKRYQNLRHILIKDPMYDGSETQNKLPNPNMGTGYKEFIEGVYKLRGERFTYTPSPFHELRGHDKIMDGRKKRDINGWKRELI